VGLRMCRDECASPCVSWKVETNVSPENERGEIGELT